MIQINKSMPVLASMMPFGNQLKRVSLFSVSDQGDATMVFLVATDPCLGRPDHCVKGWPPIHFVFITH
jgi:hypothetical protein